MTKIDHVAVFDIGGTWFRSGAFAMTGGLSLVAKEPAKNYKNTPHEDVSELQIMLVEYLARRVRHMQALGYRLNSASISMGAALNEHTGMILNSGPLWGPGCKPFDLLSALRQEVPQIEWTVINDVSAALLRHVDLPEYSPFKRINLITVSSGIACRTYSREGGYIPINKFGFQGEVGHIPIDFTIFNQLLSETCDCGGSNHLNAFSSGRGIENLIESVAGYRLPEGTSFYDAVTVGDDGALKILDAVTYPIAKTIIFMLTIDSEIEKILMTGGVVHSIATQYMNSLMRNLEDIGMYQIPEHSGFFRDVVSLGIDDDNSGLLGAAKAYDHKHTS